MTFDKEGETCKQVESPAVNVKPEDASKEDVPAGSSKIGFGLFSMRERMKTEEGQHTN